LLLPHGYEGQGAEHSSARIERFLQLCAEGNIQVVNPSTAAQYFHVLRRQGRQQIKKPLIVITPKSLLRLPEAASTIDRFTSGGFLPVIGDASADEAKVTRVLMCSGKVYYDLLAERKNLEDANTAIWRVEQFYPIRRTCWSTSSLVLRRQPISDGFKRNQRTWRMDVYGTRLLKMLDQKHSLRYVGRPPSASPATGSHTIHQMEQQRLVKGAFSD